MPNTPALDSPPRRSTRKRRAPQLLSQIAPQPKRSVLNTRPSPAPSDPPRAHFRQNPQTIFLQPDFQTLAWRPCQSSHKPSVIAKKLLRFDPQAIHDYFVSRRAANDAAAHGAPVNLYRHVGTIPLHGVSLRKKNSVHTLTDDIVNATKLLPQLICKDSVLLNCLRRLSQPNVLPWPSPAIVITASQESVKKLCRTKRDLVLEVYLGRLLFEIIADPEVMILFKHLRPSLQFHPLPTVPTAPQCFDKSPDASDGNPYTFSSVLRRAESVGYRTLTPAQKKLVDRCISVPLYPYQMQTVRWMLDKENDSNSLNDYFWEERSFTETEDGTSGHYYYFPLAGEVRLTRPPLTRGGMITEEMGLGKTIMAVALIAAQKRPNKPADLQIFLEKKPKLVSVTNDEIHLAKSNMQNHDNNSVTCNPLRHGDKILSGAIDGPYPQTLKVRRWPARTTLVVCPSSLISQWAQEARDKAPSLSLFIWNSDESDINMIIGKNAVDIVVATYEQLRSDRILLKVHWQRLVLDEAQVTRRSSTQVARDAFNLRADSRFLMTGTPIVNSLDDLKGELAFLKIWPFTLERDGFWEAHVLRPFKEGTSTALLDSLLESTMIRHSKAQSLGIKLPSRTYETIEVDLVGSHRACYCFVLGCCLEELDLILSQRRFRDTRRLRTLLKLLLAVCMSPNLLDTTALDLARRSIWGRRMARTALERVDSDGNTAPAPLRKLSAHDALEFLAESGARVVRDTKRSYAIQTSASTNALDDYMQMELDVLRAEVVSKGLLSHERAEDTARARLAALAAGGVHRLVTDSVEELRAAAVEAGLVSAFSAGSLSRNRAIALLHNHYTLLEGIDSTMSIHESGFTALTKLIEKKERPSCPVCLSVCENRIALTKCGHFYCVDCILLLLNVSFGKSRCAICRREINRMSTIEITSPAQTIAGGEAAGQERGVEAAKSVDGEAKRIQRMGTRSRSHASRKGAKSETQKAPVAPAEVAWNEYRLLGPAPRRFNHLGRSPRTPSLDPVFLRHLASSVSAGTDPPKLAALLSLIKSRPDGTKFCVVAETLTNLRAIYEYLNSHGIRCVGFGVPYSRNSTNEAKHASQEFSTNPSVCVFLLNTANAAGLTLTAAEYCVFVETLQRATDELQASARVHRIGQTKAVKIVRIIARNTIEEQIMDQRGEITSVAEEARILAMAGSESTTDEQVVDLFRAES